MFDPDKCKRCGTCLSRCLYVDYDKERAKSEIEALIVGKEAPILSACITCFACNEYCPNQARPFDLILARQEEFNSLGISPETISENEAQYAVTTEVRVPERTQRMVSACVFHRSDPGLFEGKMFEGLPLLKGRHFFCYILFHHLGAGSVTRRHAQAFVDNLAATGAEEIILIHDDCYSMLTDVVPSYGIKVPFRPVHVIEYLRDYLKENQGALSRLGMRVAYQRPCASRFSPGKEGAIDEIFELIGVERVKREYDRDNCLCCALALQLLAPDKARALRDRNLIDAERAGARFLCYLCPMCRRGLETGAQERGMGGYHIIELARMALGEIPAP